MLNAKILSEQLKSTGFDSLANHIEELRSKALERAKDPTNSSSPASKTKFHLRVDFNHMDWDFEIKSQKTNKFEADEVSMSWTGDSVDDVINKAMEYLEDTNNYRDEVYPKGKGFRAHDLPEAKVRLKDDSMDLFDDCRSFNVGGNWDIDFTLTLKGAQQKFNTPKFKFGELEIELFTDEEIKMLGF